MAKRWVKAVDRPFLITLAAILVLGLVALTSATAGAVKANPYFYVEKQLVWIGVGILLTVGIIRLDLTRLSKYSKYLYIFALVLLVVVLLFGTTQRGTTGWLGVGAAKIQPAELCKVLIIVSFADFLARRQGRLSTVKEILPAIAYVGLPLMLVLAQPDLGTGLVFIAVLFGMLFVAGANPKIILSFLVGGVAVIGLVLFLHFQFGLWLPLKDYQLARLTVFINPYNDGMGGRGDGWNTIQSLVAIGSGGLFGKGLFQGTQVQLQFLPERHTDFIYAVIGEELGFLGAGTLIILYLVLTWRSLKIAADAGDMYSSLLVIGVVTMWLFHIFENIGMSIGIMPITGIPLPFVSYGGSSLLANAMGVAIVLAVNLRGRKILF